MRSPPLAPPLTPAEKAAAYAKVVEPPPCEAAPFYMVGLRNTLLREIQQYFSSSSHYPQVPDVPTMECLTYPDGLDVLPTMSDSPPTTARGSIWLRTPGVTYEKASMGNRGELEADKAHQHFIKIFKGQFVVMADHTNHDVAVTLLDGLTTYLEGTKQHWMQRMGLTMFEVVSLSDGQELSKDPPVIRATLTVAFQGRLDITGYVESLPLKRVVHKVVTGG